MEKLGIYVHIPFCKSKCKYCDFISFSSKENFIEKYKDALLEEIKYKKILQTDRRITSIYIGGGTPSYINSEFIVEILNEIKKNYNIDKNAEITIEVNPGTITKEKLQNYKNVGINRLSIGLQSTNDRILHFIGRIHKYSEFLETYKLARMVGFNNINVDLILAIPTETMEDLLTSVENIVALEPEHISVYSMILEENTEITKMVSKGLVKEVSEETERLMYWKVKKYLEKSGYNHYEISNFCKKGFESKHNMDCWNQCEYIGFGLASHSYFENKRFSNTEDLEKYIQNINDKNFEKNIIINEVQDKNSKMKEYVMLGFRKIDGININEFNEKFKTDINTSFSKELKKLKSEGLIQINSDNIKLTESGLDYANFVFREFV